MSMLQRLYVCWPSSLGKLPADVLHGGKHILWYLLKEQSKYNYQRMCQNQLPLALYVVQCTSADSFLAEVACC